MLRELLTIRHWFEKYSGTINTYMISIPEDSEGMTSLLGHRIYSSHYTWTVEPEEVKTFYLPFDVINFVKTFPNVDDFLALEGKDENIEELKELLGAIRSFIKLKEKNDKTLTRDEYGRLDVWFWLEDDELKISPESRIEK